MAEGNEEYHLVYGNGSAWGGVISNENIDRFFGNQIVQSKWVNTYTSRSSDLQIFNEH